MSILSKTRSAYKIWRTGGTLGVVTTLVDRFGLPIPLPEQARWRAGLTKEVRFWEEYFRTRGLEWPDAYKRALDPDFALQPWIEALLPPAASVHVLDVGAGPLTYLGKKCEGKDLTITAVDPLADEYDRIILEFGVEPLVRTKKVHAEELTDRFPANSFDLVYARNCIDHSYDPERAILQMVEVAKKGSYVLLEHEQNEAEKENYYGLHQWNFSMTEVGDFLIRSKHREVNMTKKYEGLFAVACEVEAERDWLVTRIKKI